MKILRILIVFWFFLLGSCLCHAQNIDSLQKVYNNKSKPDTIRLSIASSYREDNPDTAIILAKIGLELAEKTNLKACKVYSFITFRRKEKTTGSNSCRCRRFNNCSYILFVLIETIPNYSKTKNNYRATKTKSR